MKNTNIKKKLIACIVLMLFNSCVTAFVDGFFTGKRFSKEQQTMLFPTDSDTDISNRLNINGYFIHQRNDTILGEIKDAFILYKNGTFTKIRYKDQFKDRFGKSTETLSGMLDFSSHPVPEAGIYRIEKDTLIVETYQKLDQYNPNKAWWFMKRYKYSVIDKNTLKLCHIKYFDNKEGSVEVDNYNYIYKFIKASPLPNENKIKLKKQKWMWKDEYIWKEYKSTVK
ncbi:hypothetical protein [uncultured Muribaculum sp.]|uniref:hypothetical protein n=1 Tax=uncultured Muribaculum sp. TaxID=1918613 RepID=UPI0025B76750|nr:hypothetical protein [uncultured Muribaculum sp.]